MAKRDIILNIITRTQGKDLKDLEKNLGDVGKQADKTGGIFASIGSKLSSFGDNIGKGLTGKLGQAGDAIDDVGDGLGDMSGKTALAGGAIVALGGFIAGGVKKLGELYDNTRAFNEVAGTTWEEGSRLIAVFDDLRVSSDEGASAMGKLTKTVGTTPEVLAKYGIEIVRAKDGTVNMTGTLANVAEAFKNTTDPAQRAALGSALFGKSWANIVPVLDQGGASLRKLIAGVDDSQVATEKGAKQQDELFAATDNLHDAIDGLQRSLAEHLIPTLAGLAEGTTEAVGWFDKLAGLVEKLGPSFEEANKHHIAFGKASDHVGESIAQAAEKAKELQLRTMEVIPAQAKLRDALENASSSLATQKVRAKEAGDEYKEFTQSVKDQLQAQEDLRMASLELGDATLGLEQAEIRAGDASFELSEKTRATTDAINANGASSEQAKIATEEHRRAVLDAQGAMYGAADAAVTLANKQAAANDQTLTAGQQTKVYRDELIKLRAGVADPALAAAMDAEIERLRRIAERAEDAASQLRAFNAEVRAQAGIETEFGSRDQSGVAVTRRASGGPVWPGRTYMVGENGPEMLRLNGTSPGEVLSAPESGRFTNAFPTINTNADGSVQFGGDPATYPGSVVKVGTPPKYPTLNTSNGRGGAAPTLAGYEPSTSAASGHTSAVAVTYNITVNGYADIKGLVAAIKQYEAARK